MKSNLRFFASFVVVLLALGFQCGCAWAQPQDITVSWDNPRPRAQTGLTRTKGDDDTWPFRLVLQNVEFVGNPTWNCSPEGEAANWGQWNKTRSSATWTAPTGGLKKAGAFRVSVSGKIRRRGGGGVRGGRGGAVEEKDFAADWSGKVISVEILGSDGRPITIAQRTIIGASISVSARISGAQTTAQVRNKRWTVTGSTVKSYNQTSPRNEKKDLTAADLENKDSLQFYATASGSISVSFSAVVDGVEISAQTAVFNVVGITNATFTATWTADTPKTNIGDVGRGDEVYLGGVRTQTEGISFTGSGTVPTGFAGFFRSSNCNFGEKIVHGCHSNKRNKIHYIG